MRSRKTAAILSAAIVSGGISLATMLWTSGAPEAQTASETPSAAAQLEARMAGFVAMREIPFYPEWAGSPHGHRASEAFNHWNKEGAIPVQCAKCHSTPGYMDFVGADGSAAGVVDRPAPIGTVITCVACHNSKTRRLTTVEFPSGVKVEDLGTDARCMTCHQGVMSTATVSRAVASIADDTVEAKLGFLNVHYRAAGATLMGGVVHGGYEYPGKAYGGRFQHRQPYDRCGGCHDVHTTAVKVPDCSGCHKEVTDRTSLRRIRIGTSDFDGNGNIVEGIAEEIEHLRTRLYAAIQSYAVTVGGKPIAYDSNEYPYFFIDTNNNGAAEKDEARFLNRYNAWTPRLLKAAYNFQFVTKDLGAYAHNPTYTLQILLDSLADLGAKVKVDLARTKRP